MRLLGLVWAFGIRSGLYGHLRGEESMFLASFACVPQEIPLRLCGGDGMIGSVMRLPSPALDLQDKFPLRSPTH